MKKIFTTILSLLFNFIIILILVAAPLMLVLPMIGIDEFGVTLIATQLAILIFALKIIKFDKKHLIQEFTRKITLKTVFQAILLMIILFTINIIASNLLSGTQQSDTTESVMKSTSILFSIIIPIFLAPIIEELAFRLAFKKVVVDINKHSKITFLSISSLLFGLLHWQPGSLGIILVIIVSIMGVIKGIFYLKTNNIFVTILGHIFYNASIIAIAQFVV